MLGKKPQTIKGRQSPKAVLYAKIPLKQGSMQNIVRKNVTIKANGDKPKNSVICAVIFLVEVEAPLNGTKKEDIINSFVLLSVKIIIIPVKIAHNGLKIDLS